MVYGMDSDLDCFEGSYLWHTYPSQPQAPSAGINATFTIRLPGGRRTNVPFYVAPQDPVTTGWPSSFTVGGTSATDTAYVLSSAPQSGDPLYMLVVYCATLGNCQPGGYVLAKRQKGQPSTPLPASVKDLFSRALEASGWAARYNASFANWCELAPQP